MDRTRITTLLVPSPGSLVALLALGVALGPCVPAMFRADGEVGRHTRVGRRIIKEGRIPHTDFTSHTLSGGELIPKGGASQTAMAAADMTAGLAGVAALVVSCSLSRLRSCTQFAGPADPGSWGSRCS